MKKIVLLYLTLLCANILPGQNIPVDTNTTFVIANGGLNLRSHPGKNSKKITTIPFGSTITYLSEKSFGTDSVLVRHSDSEEPTFIKGNWVRVEYQKMRGYVLDLYLSYQPRNKERIKDKFSSDIVLLYPGCGCDAENLHNPADWKWFGYFEDEEGKYKVEEVNISYYRTRIYTCDLFISASKNHSPAFIIGSKNGRLSKGEVVRGKSINLYRHSTDKPINKSDLDEASVELIEKKEVKSWEPSELYLINGEKRQLLNSPEYDYPFEIKFVGDLDGDFKDDFIIHYGDKTGIIILYLTTKARPGNLIQQVAMFFASYCC
jgi:hypothetical protein